MMKFSLARLYGRLTLRHFQQDPLRLLLTLLGVSLGVALVVSIQLASGAALSSFQQSVDLMAGKANLAVRQEGEPFPEDLYRTLAWTRKEAVMVPVVLGKMAPSSQPKDILTVLGTDLLRDDGIRDYLILGPEGKVFGFTDFLRVLPQPDAVFLTQKFADRNGLKAGGTAPFLVHDRLQNLTIVGLLADQGAGKALDGSFALMDVAAAQKVFAKLGKLDELQWAVGSEDRRADLERRLRATLPTSFRVERPSLRGGQVEKMLKAFHANLLALSLVSLLVGAFLVYNFMSLSVLRRTEEIGTLRTLGWTRLQATGLVLSEAVGLGFLGSLLGLGLGRALAVETLKLVGHTVRDIYLFVPLEERIPPLASAWVWALLGMAFITLAALPPALAASRVQPALSARKGSAQAAYRERSGPLAWAGFLCWGGAVFLGFLPAFQGLPLGGYGSAFLLLLGAAFLTPWFTRLFCAAGEGAAGGALPAEARLALKNLLSGLGRSSVAVGALVMGVGLMVSVAVMVGSFRSTVVLWLDQTLKADLYIRSAADEAGKMDSFLDPATLQAVSRTEGLVALEKLRGVQYGNGSENLFIMGMDVATVKAYGHMVFKTPGNVSELLGRVEGKKAVLISEPLALKRGLKVGDWLPLQTPSGAVTLPIQGVFYDYSNDRGTVAMDRPVFAALFKDDHVNAAAAYFKPGVSPEEARSRMLSGLPAGARVFVRTNGALRQEALRVFDQTFAITYAMEAIAVLVAVLGILATLTALILERSGEIAVLRYLGATRGQVQTMIFWEAGWMGFLGNLLGLGVGLLLAFLLVYVINVQSFGWTIQWKAPWGFLARALGVVGLATLLAGIYPAWVASRMPTMKEVNPE